MTDEEIIALFDRCSKPGPLGRGTTSWARSTTSPTPSGGRRRHWSATGRTVSIGRDLSTVADRLNHRPRCGIGYCSTPSLR